MVQVDCPETGASRCCPSQVCAGEPGQSLPAHSHGDSQTPPRHFPYPRDEMRPCWQPASPLCQHSLPALSKTLWARLQGAQLPCACSRMAEGLGGLQPLLCACSRGNCCPRHSEGSRSAQVTAWGRAG